MKPMSQATKMPALDIQCSSTGKDTDLVFVFQDTHKKAVPQKGSYSESITRLNKGGAFNAGFKSLSFLRFAGQGGPENALLIGAGQADELTEERMRILGGLTYQKLVAEKVKSAALLSDTLKSSKLLNALLYAFLEGITLRAYRFQKHKSDSAKEGKEEETNGLETLSVITTQKTLKTDLTSGISQLEALGAALDVTRDWSNEPSNVGTPEYYATQAQVLARKYGLKCKVLTQSDAAKEKMGLFLGVGQGSKRESRIVVLEYSPKGGKKHKTIALVGKGVTFDSGGISLKPSMKMEEMKHDMSGASTMMGAILLASRRKVPNRIIAILAFTENMPDGLAIQPGNILKSRSGKTVEIINTDAEGRLILADALDYCQDLKPDVIIDAATLTGACGVALGRQCCALFGNDEKLIQSLKQTGERLGERMWELPLYDEYFEDMKSEFADMKNSVNDSMGGTIRGAMFLKQFIRSGFKWAHLDIAYTATDMGHIPYYPKKGASGMFVRSLVKFAEDF